MRKRMTRLLAGITLVLGVSLGGAPSVWAQDLTVGLGIPITSLDPHFANNSPNKAVARHFFEALVAFDEKLNVVPALATFFGGQEPGQDVLAQGGVVAFFVFAVSAGIRKAQALGEPGPGKHLPGGCLGVAEVVGQGHEGAAGGIVNDPMLLGDVFAITTQAGMNIVIGGL